MVSTNTPAAVTCDAPALPEAPAVAATLGEVAPAACSLLTAAVAAFDAAACTETDPDTMGASAVSSAAFAVPPASPNPHSVFSDCL